MRTSRISQETSKIVQATSGPLRRSTRASLGRFTHNVNSGLKNEEDSNDDSHTPPAVDIEDIIAPPHKRKRSITSTPQKTKTIKTEIEDTVTFSPSPKKDRKSRKPARKIKTEDGGEAVEPPSDWEEIYSLVMAMRKTGVAQNAAVDTMGCESLARDNLSPRDRRFQTLVALMLSSQTKDTTNAIAMGRLQNDLPACEEGKEKGLNLENILAVDPVLLNELIWVVGFHNNKTRYIKATAEILRDKYDGDIPDTIEGLMSLPGVGPKMGYLCLSAAWGKDEGIGVDVHVHRITNLWGWHGKETKNPEETRLALQSWLPRDKWHEINWLLVGLGQTVCLPVGRKCGDCEVGLKGLCRSAERGKISIGRKKREEIIKTEAGEVVGVKEKYTKEEILVMEGVVNAEEDVGVEIKDGKIVDVEVEEGDVQEGLSKEEETKAIEEMVTAPGQFEKNLPKRRKR